MDNTLINSARFADVPFFSFKNLVTVGKISHIVDGDTAHIVMFDEHNKLMKLTCRMDGIDTPETKKTPELARKARNRFVQLATSCKIDVNSDIDKYALNKLIDANNTKIIYIDCFGADKYGRELTKIYIDEDKQLCVNDILIKEGYARSYSGGTKSEFQEK